MAQVFLTAQGRALALATCYVLSAQSVLLTAPAEACSQLAQRLDKHIMFGDQVCPGLGLQGAGVCGQQSSNSFCLL